MKTIKQMQKMKTADREGDYREVWLMQSNGKSYYEGLMEVYQLRPGPH